MKISPCRLTLLSKEKLYRLVNNQKFILFVWCFLVLVVSIKQVFLSSYNNYLIFKYVYWHALDRLPLYASYAHQYADTNHYGPFFSLIIAPFALLPDYLGILFWQLANVLFLFFVIKQLPLPISKVNIIYWVITHELLTAMFNLQPNISIAAIIVFSYILILQGKNFWAVFFIMLGTFIKLYGIVGLAFFFFARQKPKFILYCIFWALLMFTLPMLFFSPDYILQCYQDWYVSLSEKQISNAMLTSTQDVSLMGLLRRISGIATIPNLPIILGGLILFALPYLRIKYYKAETFRLLLLASTLIFVVIFSNSSESPTYIIAFTGVAIWFVVQEKPLKPMVIFLFVLALLLTSFSPSDLFPKYLRETYVKPFSLKALPCILIWLAITWQLSIKKFTLKSVDSNE